MDERRKGIVNDFDMSFWRGAWFAIKREVAAIPAALILVIAGFILIGIIGKIILSN
jgi:hypothetical protein